MNLLQAQGITLRRIRESKDYTMRWVSYKSGVSLGHISQIERSQKDASTLIVESIITTLGVTQLEYLEELAWTIQGKK